jgi:hemin uptake protein HemP
MESDEKNGMDRGADRCWLSRPQKAIDVTQWFRESPEVLLVHGEDVYRLRLTRSGKLLLTK